MKLERAVSAYEAELQRLTRSLEALKEKYREAVSFIKEKDGALRQAEFELLEARTALEIAGEALARKNREYEELLEKCGALFEAGRQAQEKYEHEAGVNRHLESEKARLEEENAAFRGRLANDKREMFGSRSEKTGNLMGGQPVQEDPTAEDAACAEEAGEEGATAGPGRIFSASSATDVLDGRIGGKARAPRNGGNHKTDPFKKFRNLEQACHFEHDEGKEADPRYRLIRYEDHWELRETRPTCYVYHILTPVFEERTPEGARLVSVPMKVNLWPGSYVSSSLFSRVVTEKFVRGVTLYSMEDEYRRRGIGLCREAMSRWIIHFSENAFREFCDHLGRELDERFLVQQMDETWLTQVLWSREDREKGKKNGAKGFLWERISGELSDGPSIVLFTYSKTRGVEFLKGTLKNFAGYLLSDAYAAYFAMEKIKGPIMKTAVCWMHCRRYLAIAMMVICTVLKMWDGKTEEEILGQPSVKALMISNRIFEEDAKLKGLTAEERHDRRQERVAPIVDEFFELINGLDLEDEDMFEALRKAVVYARNQEARLRVFLEDGEIPIDNGHCERQIKHAAKVRRSCLFAYTELGADAFGRCMSIVRTAIENGADPYFYIKFIIEEYAKLEQEAVADRRGWFGDRMPWSPVYIEWEQRQKAGHVDERVPESEMPSGNVKIRFKGEPPDALRALSTRGGVAQNLKRKKFI